LLHNSVAVGRLCLVICRTFGSKVGAVLFSYGGSVSSRWVCWSRN